jgi:hypothetical protein
MSDFLNENACMVTIFHPCPKFNSGLVLDKKIKEKELIRYNLVYEGGLGT